MLDDVGHIPSGGHPEGKEGTEVLGGVGTAILWLKDQVCQVDLQHSKEAQHSNSRALREQTQAGQLRLCLSM